jgi:anaerobic ribonucleoside-triphosphate reductase activating protein
VGLVVTQQTRTTAPGGRVLRVHHFLPLSYANGPGRRAVLWVQGCTLGCPGCFNPETHRNRGGEQVTIDDLFNRFVTLVGVIEGIKTDD